VVPAIPDEERLIRRLAVAAILILTPLVTAAPVKAAKPEPRCPQYERLLRKHGLPVREFSFYMWRESKCVPQAIGWNYRAGKSHRDCRLSPWPTYRKCSAVRSYDMGLLQVNSTWRTVTAKVCKAPYGRLSVLLSPECNVKVAAYLYRNGGSDHWKGTSGA
jgi:hypothetical protein